MNLVQYYKNFACRILQEFGRNLSQNIARIFHKNLTRILPEFGMNLTQYLQEACQNHWQDLVSIMPRSWQGMFQNHV
jgi:hypothetical protein